MKFPCQDLKLLCKQCFCLHTPQTYTVFEISFTVMGILGTVVDKDVKHFRCCKFCSKHVQLLNISSLTATTTHLTIHQLCPGCWTVKSLAQLPWWCSFLVMVQLHFFARGGATSGSEMTLFLFRVGDSWIKSLSGLRGSYSHQAVQKCVCAN